MASASIIKETIRKDFLECPICLEPYKDPRCLPCLHTSCSQCLSHLLRSESSDWFLCPVCKCDTQIPENGVLGFPIAFHINALQDVVRSSRSKAFVPPCHNKKKLAWHDGAAVKCLECNVYYCNACNNGHKLAVVAENHETIPLSDLTQRHFEIASQKQVTYCQQHSNTPLHYYCVECQIPVCQRCSTTKHRRHEIADLEEFSTECREQNNKILQEDFMYTEETLEKRREEIEQEIEKVDEEFDRNKKIVDDRYMYMKNKLKKKQLALINDAERSATERIKGYQQQLREINAKLTSLGVTQTIIENMTNFSPDDVIVKQHRELQQKAMTALEDTTPPELWKHRAEVTPTGESVVDMKLEIKAKSQRVIKGLNHITGVVLHKDFLIAWLWNSEDEPTNFFVNSRNERDTKFLKENLEKFCPHAYRIVSIKNGDSEVLAIFEGMDHVLVQFKMLNTTNGECKTIHLHEPIDLHVCALTVDRNTNILYTYIGTKVAIKKMKRGGSTTIFENKAGFNYLKNPWNICVNINDNIIIADSGSYLIFNAKGTKLNTYSNFPAGTTENPCDVCTDKDGDIYVADYHGHCIHHLDRDGVFLEKNVSRRDGLKFPTAVACNDGILVVGQADGYIKYFEL